jgi:transglutaminase-like putative cysteine protease
MRPAGGPSSAWQHSVAGAVGVLATAGAIVLAGASPARAQPASHISSGPTPPWVDGIASQDPGGAPSDSIENGLRFLLYDEELRVGGKGGASDEAYHHSVQQIVDESGLSAASQLQIDFDPTYQSFIVHSLTLRRDGQAIDRLDLGSAHVIQRESNLEAQVYDGRQTVVLFLSDLRVGDVIDWSYTLRGSDPTLEGKFASTVALGAPVPIARLRVRVLTPEEKPLRILLRGPKGSPPPAPAETKRNGEVTYIWDARDVPAFRVEPSLPSWYSPVPYASLSSFDSWQEVAESATRLFRSPPPGSALREWVRTQERKAGSPDQFLLAAIRFVQDQVRYVAIEVGMARRVPGDPDTTFAHRYGDCKEKAALLVAMLRLAGLQAQPVLVSTTLGHTLDRWSPTPLAFDHVIVKAAMTDGLVYWIDATEVMQGGGLLAFQTAPFERALSIDPPGRDLENVAPLAPSTNVLRVLERYRPSMPGAASDETRLEVTRTYEGELADVVRLELRAETDEDRVKTYRGLYERDFPGIRVVGPIQTYDDRDANYVTTKVRFIIPQFWSGTSTTGFRGDLIARAVSDVLVRPEPGRSSPLRIAFPFFIEQKIESTVPFDPSRGTPHPDLVDTPAWRLDVSARRDNQTVTYRYAFETKRDVVEVSDLATQTAAVDRARLLLGPSVTYWPRLPDSTNWTGLAAIALTLPICAWAARRLYRYEPALVPGRAADLELVPAPPRRIGGGLLVLGAWLAVAPLILLLQVVADGEVVASTARWQALTTQAFSTYRPAVAALIAGRILSKAALIAYAVTVHVLLWRRRRRFPFHGKVYLCATIAIHFANVALTRWLGTEKDLSRNVILWLAIVVGLSALGFVFLTSSHRVARTFVRD